MNAILVAAIALQATPTPPTTALGGSIYFELAKGVPAAFVALVIGLIAASIAWHQYRVARAKLKLDLFEKRYAIFLETWKILSETVNGTTLSFVQGLGTPFNNIIPQASFLFGREIEDYLNVAASNWAQLRGLQSKAMRSAVVSPPSEIAEQTELEQWFFREAEQNAKRLFGLYLSFEGWK